MEITYVNEKKITFDSSREGLSVSVSVWASAWTGETGASMRNRGIDSGTSILRGTIDEDSLEIVESMVLDLTLLFDRQRAVVMESSSCDRHRRWVF